MSAASDTECAKRALGDALERVRPRISFDTNGYAVELEDNLLPGITRSQIEDDFAAGAGKELDGKMRAPWSSSALAVNSFAPWAEDVGRLTLAGMAAFTGSLAFEVQCPNGVSQFPPHLDVLLERDLEVVGVESKCTEYMKPKTMKVSTSYLALAERGDTRASSRWFAVLAEMSSFRVLDAYQLVKHYLGLRLSYPDRAIALVYIYWEPTNAGSYEVFEQHRGEVKRFGDLVAGDPTCRFVALSYPEHWAALDTATDKPAWLDAHLLELRRRYAVAI